MKKRFAFAVIAAAVIASGLFFYNNVVNARIIAKAVAPDGTQICVQQFFTWTTEMFYTSVFSKKPGRNWGWFYYDHQDSLWLTGRIDLDTNNGFAVVLRGNKAVGRYDWTNDTFTLFRRGTTNTPEQASWTPEQKKVSLRHR